MRRATQIHLRLALRRAALFLLLPALALLAFRLYWGYHAQKRLDAALAKLRAMHVRLAPEEFPDDSAVPKEQNAVEAILSIPPFQWTRSDDSLIDDPLEYQSAADKDAVLKLVASHQDVLDHIDAAQSRPAIVWPRAMLKPDWHILASGLLEYGRLLQKAARIAHERHDNALALQHLRRLMTIGHVFDGAPRLIYQLEARIVSDLVAQGINDLSTDLALTDAASQNQASLLLNSLLDDAAFQSGLAQSLDGEIAFDYVDTQGCRTLGINNPRDDLTGPLGPLAPLALETWARALDQKAAIVAAWRAPNYPQFAKLSANYRLIGVSEYLWSDARSMDDFDTLLHMNAWHYAYADKRYTEMLAALVHRRAVAMLLAAHLYAARHFSLPTSADQLKDCLPADLPIDPFLEGQHPLHYRLDPTGPTLWSVGTDGIDNHADKKLDIVLGAANPPLVPPPPKPARPPTVRIPIPTTRSAPTPATSKP